MQQTSTPVKWTTQLQTGVIWQDMQHIELLDKLCALHYAISESREISEVEDTFNFLDHYTKSHFAIEERYMAQFQYAAYQLHKQQHEKFISDLNTLKKDFSVRNKLTSFALCFDLNTWFVDHINVADKQLGAFLKNKA
ncbi:MAG: hemerythrin family protein [Nitrospirae bacterium]|uniref:bacteriohemerythrin n=1 Tax=Candidatus Magnetobacterium casense TaxID=1455061 RepID=UPI000696CE25|nr:hemerythrin family protein [Candidatus Magnetobacterium casensis]MBF0338996.1 hemerythrin family protein [Nitrospirota bacterium]